MWSLVLNVRGNISKNLAIQSEIGAKTESECVPGGRWGSKNHKCFDYIFSNRAMKVKCYLL